jgi:5-methylcytosine-specific restriction protein B
MYNEEQIVYSHTDTSEQMHACGTNYWWIIAYPEVSSFSSVKNDGAIEFLMYDNEGKTRVDYHNLLNAKEGDFVIGYESDPVEKIIALYKVSREYDGECLYVKMTENLTVPIEFDIIKIIPEIKRVDFINIHGVTLLESTKEVYDTILNIIREQNPVSTMSMVKHSKYTKSDFLNEVYISDSDYETLTSLLIHKKNIILQGAPGVGKTFTAKRLAYSIRGCKDESKIKLIQFHQSYSYEDFIMGYKPEDTGFVLRHGIFYDFCIKAADNPDEKYFFIIDEINRGNLSKIFGELLMMIEADYRGEQMTMAYDGMPFCVPENLYIIGMMNTADRSLAMIDYALRRRFSFYSMSPAFDNDVFIRYQKTLNTKDFDDVMKVIKRLNKEISEDASLGEGFCIGHSYFCGQTKCTKEWLQQVIKYDIIPMINEYWFDDKAKAEKLVGELLEVLN